MFLLAYNPELNLIEGGYGMVKIIYYPVSKAFKVKLIYIYKVITYEYEELIKSLMRGR